MTEIGFAVKEVIPQEVCRLKVLSVLDREYAGAVRRGVRASDSKLDHSGCLHERFVGGGISILAGVALWAINPAGLGIVGVVVGTFASVPLTHAVLKW